MAVCDITVIPGVIDKNKYKTKTDYFENNIYYSIIDKIIEIIKNSGLKYKVCAMSTTVEGPADKLFELAKLCHKTTFEYGARDVITQFRLHESLIFDDTIEGKTKKFEK